MISFRNIDTTRHLAAAKFCIFLAAPPRARRRPHHYSMSGTAGNHRTAPSEKTVPVTFILTLRHGRHRCSKKTALSVGARHRHHGSFSAARMFPACDENANPPLRFNHGTSPEVAGEPATSAGSLSRTTPCSGGEVGVTGPARDIKMRGCSKSAQFHASGGTGETPVPPDVTLLRDREPLRSPGLPTGECSIAQIFLV